MSGTKPETQQLEYIRDLPSGILVGFPVHGNLAVDERKDDGSTQLCRLGDQVIGCLDSIARDIVKNGRLFSGDFWVVEVSHEPS